MSKVIKYSDAELAWIESNCQRPRAEAHAEFVDRFGRHDVVLANFTALCKRKGWLTGRSGRFDKGVISWNQMPFNPASAATQFKKVSCRRTRSRWGTSG